jgi:hypothetical protein
MGWVENLARVGERREAYRVSVEEPEVNRPFGIPRRRWNDNIGWLFRKWDEDMDWIDLAQGRDRWRSIVKTAMNLPVA